MRRFSALLLLPLLVLPAFVMFSDAPGTTPSTLEITGVNAAAAPEVTLTVDVTDLAGQTVGGLSIDNFHLGGALADVAQIVRVERVTEDNLPFATVLVIDTSSSMAGTPLQRTKAAAKDFVSALGAEDQVALIAFADDPVVIREFTADKADLIAAIDNLGFGGQTALYDGAVAGIELAANAPFPRRAVILLSDGAEYGGASLTERADGPDLSPVRGVPVYTIGLGFGLDRTYLQQLSDASSARFSESPTPEELAAIYADLASLFRSQYIVTIDFQGPLDGRIYPFTLRASNAAGQSNVDAATLRAPIPVPVVTVSPLPSAPLAAPVSFTASTRGDQPVTQVEFVLNGTSTVDVEAPYVFDFDPFTSTPGDYSLVARATDSDGDIGEFEVPFVVAAIPSRIALDTDLSALGPISAPVNIGVTADSQTPPQSVDFRIDGTSMGASSGLPATFTLDPFTLAPGPHTVEFVVTDASGAQAAITQTAQIAALPPQINVNTDALPAEILEDASFTVEAAGQTPIENIAFTLNGVVETVNAASASYTIRPAELVPGDQSVTVVVTDQSGTSAAAQVAVNIGVLPPVVAVIGIANDDVLDAPRPVTVTVSGQTSEADVTLLIDAAPVTVEETAPYEFVIDPAAFSGAGTHLVTFSVVNEFGATVQQDIRVTVPESVFPSPSPLPTETPNAAETAAAESLVQQSTSEAQATADAQSLLDQQATADAQLTEAAQATGVVVSTQSAQSTLDAAATDTAILASTSRANAASQRQATVEARATQQAQSTLDLQLTEIAQQTAAAIATIDAQATLDVTQAVVTQEAATLAASTALARDAEQTAIARETAQVQLTADAQGRATAQVEMALARQSTADAVSTGEAVQLAATSDAATLQADSALTAVAQAEETLVALTQAVPTAVPTDEPTVTLEPTAEPTLEPTAEPTSEPTAEPTEEPSDEPTAEATVLEPTPTVFDPTSTPGAPTDVIAQGADAPDSQVALLAVACGIGLLVLIVVLISMARRRK